MSAETARVIAEVIGLLLSVVVIVVRVSRGLARLETRQDAQETTLREVAGDVKEMVKTVAILADRSEHAHTNHLRPVK